MATVGFGINDFDFDVLRKVYSLAQDSGAKATFTRSNLDQECLGTVLTSVISSVTETRIQFSRLNHEKSERELVSVDKENFDDSIMPLDFNTSVAKSNWTVFNSTDNIQREELKWVERSNIFQTIWTRKEFQNHEAKGFAVAKKIFSFGTERNVFKMTEISREGHPLGPPVVAKSSRHRHDEDSQEWHRVFIQTQMKAENLAGKFNRQLDQFGVSRQIPRVSFLQCTVYHGFQEGSGMEAYLSEKMLDLNQYRKWNDNKGGVDGLPHINEVDHEKVYQPIILNDIWKISEEENEDEEEDHQQQQPKFIPSSRTSNIEKRILESDIPPAFSHFTHHFTKRQLLVCEY